LNPRRPVVVKRGRRQGVEREGGRGKGGKEGGREGGEGRGWLQPTCLGIEIDTAHLALGYNEHALAITGNGVGDLVVARAGEVSQGEGIHQHKASLPVDTGGHEHAGLATDDDGPVFQDSDTHQVVVA